VRAVLRLVRPGLGAEFRRADAAVRDAARELSALRDARATLSTFDDLVAATGGGRGPGDGLAGVRAGLARRSEEAGRADAPAALAAAGRRLARVRARVDRWAPDDDRAIVLAGLEDNYRRARRAFEAAREDPRDDALHEWRKRAKYGWHHASLLRPLAPSAFGAMASDLRALSDGLGDDHDLAVLREMILADPGDFGGDGSEEAIVLIDATRADLQDRCLRLGARVYAEPPGAFRRRAGRYWAAWDDLGRERPVGTIRDLAREPGP
jgi:hypothetical protein